MRLYTAPLAPSLSLGPWHPPCPWAPDKGQLLLLLPGLQEMTPQANLNETIIEGF